MDAFYASIEQRDHPELRGRPVAVGYPQARGVVAAASYEARQYGVRSALPSLTAKSRCPELIFMPPRFEVYKAVSMQIMEIFQEYSTQIEPLSLDEAFLDVSQDPQGIGSAILIARLIKARILEQTGLTASAGVSFNKFLAKIASDYRKPNGLFAILPQEAEAFVAALHVERFFGVGKVTAQKMHSLGIFTGQQLRDCSKDQLKQFFGKAGLQFYDNARAIDKRPVISSYPRKSVGTEMTFDKDLNDMSSLTIELYHIAKELMRRAEKAGFYGRSLHLKIKFHDFETITRSKSQDKTIAGFASCWPIAKELLQQTDMKQKKIRLLGLSLGLPQEEAEGKMAVAPQPWQGSLF